MAGGAARVRQRALVDEDDVLPAQVRQVVGDAVADDAGADDDDLRASPGDRSSVAASCCKTCNCCCRICDTGRDGTPGRASARRAAPRRCDGARTGVDRIRSALELVAAEGWMSATELAVAMGVDRSTGWRLATLARAGRLAPPGPGQRPIPPRDAAVRAGHPRPRHHRRPRRGPTRHDRARGLDRRERRPGDPRRRQRGLHRQDRRHRGGPRVHPERPAGLAARDRRRQGLPRRICRPRSCARYLDGPLDAYTPATITDPGRARPGRRRDAPSGAGRSTAASSTSRRAPSPCPCSTRWAGASRRWGSTSRSRGSTTTTSRTMVEQLRRPRRAWPRPSASGSPWARRRPGGAARDGALTDRRRGAHPR